MKKLIHFLASTVAVMMFLGLSIAVVEATPCKLANFASASFTNPTNINNPYLPWVPGTEFLYEPVPNPDNVQNFVRVLYSTDPKGNKQITVGTKTIAVVVVHDYEIDNGFLAEDTYDYYAQDDDGNVWYCGEDTTVYLPGGGTDKTGSWEAGVNGALPGYIMLAKSSPGVCYWQEFLRDVAEDEAKVMRLNAKVTLQSGKTYQGCLETKEWSPLEVGDIEQKFYAKGVGMVLNFEHRGKILRWELISVSP